ncbi:MULTISPECIES: hypothetical protein [Flammeovirga]|uniref:Uncharacterized protein n=1 Tax=Flammeovirga agarivorans TaxID=2726742 RepID=A0A7X8SHV6_9BACT|nr:MULTISPECIES: hypothetical protein [Flammeovirga]NLR90486.1 hypothetical protein [Flammeovirga agarivorans]
MKKFLLFLVPVAFLALDYGVIDSAINADTTVGTIMACIASVMMVSATIGVYPLLKNS